MGAHKDTQQIDSRRALSALRNAKERILELESRAREPLALVGLSCRFPGGDTAASFWAALEQQRDCVGEIPDERVLDAWPKDVPRWAGLIDRVDGFDAEFFGISPREAQSLDPQQRLLLEVCWEALEHARLVPQRMQGSRTGVFVGQFTLDYQQIVYRRPVEERGLYDTTGIMASTAAGRISYTLGLQGPAVTVDTACSSALVAIHLACQSLRSGESDLALAGGVNLLLSEVTTLGVARAQALSPDGRCRTFDASANGYVRGEGCGVVVLKRLADARRDGDRVLAIVRGSAMNHGGRSAGLTAPNVLAQERLLRDALRQAGLEPSDIGFIECHGTGTSLGDPIEIDALRSVFGEPRPDGSALWLGAVKTNIGHLEAAAGMPGFIKAALALQNGKLPANLHLRHVNPRIRLDGTPLRPLVEAVAWEGRGRPRRAGVSSFGMSGTNAHVILEEAPPETAPHATSRPSASASVPVVLSGRTASALRAQAGRLADHLEAHPGTSPLDLAFSLATTRAHFAERLALGAPEIAELRAFARDGSTRKAAVTPADHTPGKLAMLMTGQGSQLPGMGRGLHETFPAFRDALDAVCAELDRRLPRPLRSVMFAAAGTADAALLDETGFTQPALFALEVALFRLWESWGVTPDVLLGHSIGELAAAHVAGVLSLADACTLVAARAQLMQALPPGGAMVSLQASETEVVPVLAGREAHVGIAALNGASATVVSGDEAAVLAVAAHFEALGRKATRLKVSHAFHSPRMDAMLAAFGEVARSLAYGAPRIPIVSNVTGRSASAEELTSPDYWVRHVRDAVRFVDGARALAAEGVGTWLELGPQGVLSAMAASFTDAPGAFVPSLRKDAGDVEALGAAASALHVRGHELDWNAFFAPFGARRIDLPTYAFQRERYWVDASKAVDAAVTAALHPFLRAATPLADGSAIVFSGRLSLAEHRWLAGHKILGTVLLPGTAFVEIAAAVAQHVGLDCVHELTLEAPVALPEDAALALQVAVGAAEAGRRSFALYTRRDDGAPDAPWTRHAAGTLGHAPVTPSFDLRAWPPLGAAPVDLTGLYDRLAERGLAYDGEFRGLHAAWKRDDDLFAEVRLPTHDARQFGLHPALLDAALHLLALASSATEIQLPFSWSGVTLLASGASAARVQLSRRRDAVSLAIADTSGAPVALVDALHTRPASEERIRAALRQRRDDIYRVEWTEAPRCAAAAVSMVALVDGAPDLTAALARVGVPVRTFDDVATLAARLDSLLTDERLTDARLVVLTRRAVAASAGEDVRDLAHAPVWGLVRAAQSEHPDRAVALVDLDDDLASLEALRGALASPEPQLAVRRGQLLCPRLVRAGDVLTPPADCDTWRLDIPAKGTLSSLAIVPHPAAGAALAAGQVRLLVRAAGLNFRDVLNALGMYPGDAGPLGLEGAGIVTEVGPGVVDLRPGDRVMGLFSSAIGRVAIADARTVVRMPRGWSFEQAAAVPVTFLTAYYALFDLGRLQAGERILVHAAAGGVGMAAVQIARFIGAEVFGTASPGKWSTLRRLGLDEAHIASSRSLEFEERFMATTAGRGMDVVLNSLTEGFVDASLRLLPRGGRFLEMGKLDVRGADTIADDVVYRPFDLSDAGPERIGGMLAAIVALFERGALQPLPVTSWGVAHALDAFRFLAQARHVGKVVLTLPRRLAPDGTILITGGTGGLGALVARHLVAQHGARHLLLASRRGPDAPGAAALRAELAAAGARVTVAACDVSDRRALEDLLRAIPASHPLTAVIHSAGVLDDGLLASLTPERIDRVFRPKAEAALHLHALTEGLDLAAFVLFSSVASVVGSPAQGNYAAANALLDALAAHRRARGLAATSLSFGPWAESGMAARLSSADRARLERQGLPLLRPEEGLALFDAALAHDDAHLVPVRIDATALAALDDALPPVLRGLVRHAARRVPARSDVDTASIQQLLASMAEAERERFLLDLVRTEVASVLGLPGPRDVDPLRPLQELGLDSLMAVELRNRLSALTGLKLPSTALFDHPTPDALARLLRETLVGAGPDGTAAVSAAVDRLDAAVAEASLDSAQRADLAARLRMLLSRLAEPSAPATDDDLESFTNAELFEVLDGELGIESEP